METEKYPFGILECRHGHIGMFIEEMMALGHPCVGIWEPEQPQLAKSLSGKYGVPLLEEEAPLWEPEVRVIGTSAVNNRKIGIIERCEEHGKHVMVDKPAVTDREQLNWLEAVVRRGRIQVGMLLTERFRPSVLKLKSEIDAGRLGRIASITMRKPHRLAPKTREAWHFQKEQNGGIVIDLFIHDVDLVRYLTGQNIACQQCVVTKLGQAEHPDFYDAAGMQLLLQGGTMAQLYADWHTPDQSWTWGDLRIFVTGTEGAAELRLNGDPAVAKEELYFQVTNQAPFTRVEPDRSSAQASITSDFLLRIAGGLSTLTHGDLLAASEAVITADEQAESVR